MSSYTGKWVEQTWANTADGTAVASSATEASLLGGLNDQPVFPALFFEGPGNTARGVRICARGIFSNTGTPTIIWQVRLGTTQGSASLAGTSVGVSKLITTASGVTNAWWELNLELIARTTGMGGGNCTLSGSGNVKSPVGFGSPFDFELEPTTPPTGTWTATIDASLTQYLNLSITWGTSSSSNTCTLKHLAVDGRN